MRLFYATTNPGKIFEVGKFLKPFGIELFGPKDLGLSIDVPEEGETLEENAIAKVKAYIDALHVNLERSRKVDAGVDMLVMADDTGIEIDALGGEPGIHVRRWKDGKRRMIDEEIIAYCLARMKGIPLKKRTAQFRTVIAIGAPKGLALRMQGQALSDNSIELFDGVLRGIILEKPAPLRIEGFPFESLFYIPEWKMVLGDVHQLPAEKKNKFLSHRERAVEKTLPRIRSLL